MMGALTEFGGAKILTNLHDHTKKELISERKIGRKTVSDNRHRAVLQ
jgi:hypothetical protein